MRKRAEKEQQAYQEFVEHLLDAIEQYNSRHAENSPSASIAEEDSSWHGWLLVPGVFMLIAGMLFIPGRITAAIPAVLTAVATFFAQSSWKKARRAERLKKKKDD